MAAPKTSKNQSFRCSETREPAPQPQAPRLTCLRPAGRPGASPAARWPSRGRSRRPYRAGRPWRRAAAGRVGDGAAPGCQSGGSRAATDGRRKKRRGWRGCVFLSRCVSFSFLGAGGNTLFWENLGKTLRPARRVASRRHTSAPSSPLLSLSSPLLSCAASALRAYKPLPPRATAGRMRINLLAIFCFWVGLPVLLGLLRHMADGSVCPHLFLKLYYVAPLFHWLRDRNRVNQLLIQYAYGGI